METISVGEAIEMLDLDLSLAEYLSIICTIKQLNEKYLSLKKYRQTNKFAIKQNRNKLADLSKLKSLYYDAAWWPTK